MLKHITDRLSYICQMRRLGPITLIYVLLFFSIQKGVEANHTNVAINIVSLTLSSSIDPLRKRMDGMMVNARPIYDITWIIIFIFFLLFCDFADSGQIRLTTFFLIEFAEAQI